MHVCMHACMYECMYVYICVCMHVCIYIYIYIYIYMCVCVCVCVCMCVCVCVCVRARVFNYQNRCSGFHQRTQTDSETPTGLHSALVRSRAICVRLVTLNSYDVPTA